MLISLSSHSEQAKFCIASLCKSQQVIAGRFFKSVPTLSEGTYCNLVGKKVCILTLEKPLSEGLCQVLDNFCSCY